MTAHAIALTAVFLGLMGLVEPRVGFFMLAFFGIIYLTLGETPFSS